MQRWSKQPAQKTIPQIVPQLYLQFKMYGCSRFCRVLGGFYFFHFTNSSDTIIDKTFIFPVRSIHFTISASYLHASFGTHCAPILLKWGNISRI